MLSSPWTNVQWFAGWMKAVSGRMPFSASQHHHWTPTRNFWLIATADETSTSPLAIIGV